MYKHLYIIYTCTKVQTSIALCSNGCNVALDYSIGTIHTYCYMPVCTCTCTCSLQATCTASVWHIVVDYKIHVKFQFHPTIKNERLHKVQLKSLVSLKLNANLHEAKISSGWFQIVFNV